VSLVSAIVLTLNEAASINRCLESLSFCDEIWVIDSGSTDGTQTLARKYTPHVKEVPWKGFVETRNEALQWVSSEWVLSIDADEVVSPELREAILKAVHTDRFSAYSMPRRTLHFDRWIRYGGWYPNRLVRLFKKSQGRWIGDGVHERWETDGHEGELTPDLIHYSFEGISDQVDRNNRYSTLAAQGLMDKGTHSSLVKILFKPPIKFFETFFLKRGFKDGYPGFIIAVSAAYAVFLKWTKLWELEHVKKGIHCHD
jgi:glycosyltransferase involved in cell wall biosynthesis